MRAAAILLHLLAVPAVADDPLPAGAVARVDVKDPPNWEELALAPDGRRVAVRVKDYRTPANSRVEVTDLTTGRTVALRDPVRMVWQAKDAVRYGAWDVSLAFSPDGAELYTANYSASVAVWDAATGKHLRDVPLPPRKVESTDYDQDPTTRALRVFPARGGVMVETGHYGHFTLAAKTDKLTRHPPGNQMGTTTSGWSPDGRFIGINDGQASVEDSVFVYDIEKGRTVFASNTPPNSCAGPIVPSPDGSLVATTYSDTSTPGGAGLKLWKIDGGKEVPLAGGTGWKTTLPEVLAFAPDSAVLCAPLGDKVMRWDTATGKRLADWELPAKTGRVAFDWPRRRLVVMAAGLVRTVPLPAEE